MAVKLKKYAEHLEKIALQSGEISKDSSARTFLYDISRHWRELLDATEHESPRLDGWNEREELAAEIILSAAKYLSRKKCVDMERLIDHVFKMHVSQG